MNSLYFRRRDLIPETIQEGNIVFADSAVKTICVTNWDTNGDGELSYREAAAVTTLNKKFMSSSITSFDELKYFIGLTEFANNEFYNCQYLTSIYIPKNIIDINNATFSGAGIGASSFTVYCEPTSPPSAGSSVFSDYSLTAIYVPAASVDAYKAASGWSTYASKIQAMTT